MSFGDEEFALLTREQREAELELIGEDQLDEDGRFMFYPEVTECSQRDRDIELLVAAGDLHRCAVCGCTEATPCPGGCIWATPNLCSRCVA